MADFVINWSDERMAIDGFGASDRNCHTLSGATMDLFYSTVSGIGLSLLRCSFDVNGYNEDADPQNAVKAVARGARVWAAPWSPPGIWKTNGSENNGGHLFSANYTDWSNAFVSFYNLMKNTYGVTLMGMSIQNEPDFSAPYPSCLYSNAEIIAFIKVVGPALQALSPRPLLIAPESANWGGLWGYGDAILADGTAAALTDLFATHDYTYATTPHAATTQKLWETEVATFDGPTATIANGLTVASWIHRAFVTGNVSAWHYWELLNNSDNEGVIIDASTLTKRLYVLGNWSRFVKPGWTRVSTTGSVTNISVTAFKEKLTGRYAVVVVNNTGSTATLTFQMGSALYQGVVAPNITSGTAIGAIGTDGNLSVGSASAGIAATINPSGNQFTGVIPSGVTTFTGMASDGSSLFFGAGTTS